MRLNLAGLFFEHSGYGKMSREYAIALWRKGIDIGLFNIGNPDIDKLGIDPDKHEILTKMNTKVIYPQSPTCILYMPEMYHRINQNYFNIGYCQLETTRLPKHWVNGCNMMNEIWVPSAHQHDICKESGVKRPIYIVPQGIDTNEFKPGPGFDLDPEVKDCFKFFVNGEFIERKKIGFIIDAFCDAFTAKDNVVLIVKTYDMSDNNYKDNIPRKIKAIKGNRSAKIYLINNYIDDKDLPKLYNSIDCVIHASAGEGWSFIPFETLACGKKLIMNPWGPTKEYIPEQFYKPIAYKLVDVPMQGIPNDKVFAGSQWAEPNKASLIAQMKAEILSLHGTEMIEHMKRYEWKNAAERIIERLYEIKDDKYTVKQLAVKTPKVNILCPSWGKKCGISTYTADLQKELSEIYDVEINGDINNLTNIVHIQFQYGLYGYPYFKVLLNSLHAQGKRIILTMHDYDYKNLQTVLCNELMSERCDKIIVHSMLQLTLMKKHGINNVEFIPHGIDSESAVRNVPVKKYDIGYFGFSYSHKSIIELGFAIKELNKARETHALMLASVGINPDAEKYFDKTMRIFEDEGIDKYVDIRTAFLDKHRIIELLSQCECVCLPYEDYGNIGISGAIRVAMLAMRPIVYTDTPFFSDITFGTRIHDNKPSAIADAILNKRFSTDGQLAYINQNSWKNIALMHKRLYDAI